MRRTRNNPWSWTEAANVVWVDQPSGVGFSEGPMVATEQGVAEHMHTFLRNFFAHFPAFYDVPFFIVGESYAGHYVPSIAARILRPLISVGRPIPLRGVGIGNGLV